MERRKNYTNESSAITMLCRGEGGVHSVKTKIEKWKRFSPEYYKRKYTTNR